jgi:deazaflavin-dependent oxidoreductase (nitroreductase family)
VAELDPGLGAEDYCYLTTIGRVSGAPREIEIWFGHSGTTIYILSQGRDRSNWVRNLMRTPEVRVRIGRREFEGAARIVDDGDEDALARRLLLDKYGAGYSGDLTGWGRDSLPVAVDLVVESGK